MKMKLKTSWVAGVLATGVLVQAASAADGKFERDRAAILAMAGEYEVTFDFHESVPIAADYVLKKPYLEHAAEKVVLVEDGGRRIVLQHLLLTGNGSKVVKHWKQEWVYEDTEVFRFTGDNRWVLENLKPGEVSGMWSQRVSQVDDTPRYESTGEWTHEGGLSAWTSRRTRRPLPRREYTKRDDYEVMVAINRQTLTPDGWVHEQDNTKQVSEGGVVLCREVGLNSYERTDDVDFGLVDDYWAKTSAFWKVVSLKWDEAMRARSGLALESEVDGVPLYRAVFDLAAKVRSGELPPREANEAIDEVVRRFVRIENVAVSGG